MILVPCPYCGPRNASEFRWVGEARPRPAVADATPAEWRAYLHLRRNVAGWSVESWYHRAGCRRYFRAERHTVTNEFRAPRPAGAADVPRPRTGTAVPEETA
jgi:heterotetrameric sarcosine oxidase delta subunit